MPTHDPTEAYVRHVTDAQRSLHNYILTLIPDLAAADDVLGETNMILWRKRDEFTPASPGSDFLAFAHTIARYQALAHLKTRSRSKLRFDDALLDTLAAEAADRAALLDAKRHALAHCLDRLPDHDRLIIEHRYTHDRRVDAIAAELGRTANAVSQVLHRVRHALLACIQQRLTESEGGDA